jgi:hypothetical protein
VANNGYLKPYIDSSVWIAWIQDEFCKGIYRKPVFDHILNQAQNGDYNIYTSSATLAEVYKFKGPNGPIIDPISDKILKFFERQFIKIIDVDREIGEKANWCRSTCRVTLSRSPPGRPGPRGRRKSCY